MPNHERNDMRAHLSPGSHTVGTTGTDLATATTAARRLTPRSARAAFVRLLVSVLPIVAAVFVPAMAHAAGSIRGTVFEDMNYGGGAGRDFVTSGGVICDNSRVELFNATTGVFLNATTLDSLGAYKFNGLGVGNYIVRVVTRTVTSSRPGYIPGTHLAVMTYRTDGSLGSAIPVTNEVGGHEPAEQDANDAGSGDQINTTTWQFISGPAGYAQTGSLVNVPSVNAVVSGIDFGFSFDVITNTNDFGAGSLRQFVINADGLGNVGLSQDGFPSDTERAIWMISNGTSAAGLRADHDYFSGGVATIALQSALPVLNDPVVLDATLQPGYSGTPLVVVDGAAAGPGANGFDLVASECEVRGLTIGGFEGSGIQISGLDCLVSACWIGLDGTGSAANPNLVDGITVWADGAILGGGAPEDRNIVSGNAGDGIRIEFSSSGSSVRNNWIGTDVTGTVAIANGSDPAANAGLRVNGDNCTVGGVTADERNIISGNTDEGVRLSAVGGVFMGNSVGVDVNGAALGNGGTGVFISADYGGADIKIGGVDVEDGNIIANNGGLGIDMDPLVGEGVAILSNRIYENTGLGIDLSGDGITINDPLDTDFGPNSLQNYPEITLARTSDVDLHVAGSLAGDPSSRFRLEFFASANADPSGNGEGERFLGAALAETDAFGFASFDTTITGVVAIDEAVTATATNLDFNNTSEFSAAYLATDAAGIVVTPVSGLITSEAGDSASFSVVLESQPTGDVIIPLTSSNPAEGEPVNATITFTPADWNVPQDVWVRGVDDFVVDGDQNYTIALEPAVSTDPHYSGRDADDVDFTNTDGDVAGITVDPVTGLTTDEAGATATFTIVLDTQPSADVTMTLASNNTAEATADLATVTFTPADWNVPQTVTVTGANDFVVDGDQAWTVVIDAATSADPMYDTMDPNDVDGTNTDDDVIGVAIDPVAGLTVDEAGATAQFTVHLTSMPSADVTFTLSSSNTAEGTIDLSSLTCTPADWNIDQTVTVTGVDDVVVDGDVAFSVVTSATSSTDLSYDGFDPADVDVTNTDNDVAEVTATPSAGLVTDETGGTATFDVVLTSQPSADVTFALTSSNTAEGAPTPASITFTPADWNVPQTVTVTGADDFVMDGDVAYSIALEPITSTDPNYSGVDPADVDATNTDNDVAGITVDPTGGLTTTEAGGSETFTVVLDTQPTADVTILLDSDTHSEATVDLTTLTFTAANWNVPQTVTVSGVNDFVVDGDTPYSVVLDLATSADPNYDGMDPNDVFGTTTDDDVAGATVTPTAGLVTTEAGGTATFTVALTSQPTADVLIPVNTSDASEGTVSPGFLTFTSADWNVAQTVTVTGVNDAVDDGDIAYNVVLAAAASSDLVYDAFDADDVAVTNTDDDAAGITVNPVAGLVTTEAGGTATFTVVLTSQPTSNVVIGLSSGTPAEGHVLPASLTFTAANWNTPRTVTVTGQNDFSVDGDIAYTIAVAPAVSTDPNYSGRDGADVSVTNTDDDVAGITVAPVAGLNTTEAGGTDVFTVSLTSRPSADVVIAVASNDASEGTAAPATLTFTSANWNVNQTVTVTGVDDAAQDGNVAFTVVLDPAVSADPDYSGRDAADVSATNADDDAAGIVVSPLAGLVTTEAGGTATFTVVLGSQPTADVTIALASDQAGEGTAAPASVTFTSADWNVPQTVTVTGVDDLIDDGDVAYTIATAAATSADPNYSGVDAGDVAVTNTDDDAASITVAPVAGLTTTEAGGAVSFTAVLGSQPTADVAIAVASTNTAEGTPSANVLTFTAANWNVPQTLTVTGADDAVDDGDVAYQVTFAQASSSDPVYAALDPADFNLTNTDDDAVGISVTPVAGLTTTEAGGAVSFDVVLASQPTADVSIAVASSNTAEGTASTASLTFTATNWSLPQTVTVTGVNDLVDDGDIAYALSFAQAASADPLYAAIDPADFNLTNTDDDAAGITVTPVAGLTTTEAGGAVSFSIVLESQPTADVSVAVASTNTAEGTVSGNSVTFTAGNWNVAQTVTVTGVNDLVQDGDIAYSVTFGQASSADPVYAAIDPADFNLTNTDDDAASITVTPLAGLTTTEAGGAVSFSVVLGSQPTADVTIAVASTNTAEGTVSANSLTFTAGDWNVAQTVTVTGVNDLVQDGDIAYSVTFGQASSADPVYAAIDPADFNLTNTDDDAASITVTPLAGLTTTEAGGAVSFSVVLGSQPTADVTIAVASTNTAEGTVSASSVTFTAGNWNVAQTVTVTGVDDQVQDGNIAYTLTFGQAASSDPLYAAINPADFNLTNTDDDAAGITVAPVAGLVTTEGGGTASFTVVLRSQPTGNVQIPVSSTNPAEGTVPMTRLTFTPANWSVAQTVTVTGADDLLQDGDIAYTIILGSVQSTDMLYFGTNPPDVGVTNLDNDASGISVSPVAGLVTTEAGGSASFSVALVSQPVSNVVIPVASSDASEGTASPATLTFTPANWNVAQTVTVTGADDAVQDGAVAYTVVLSPAGSADPVYTGADAPDVAVSNTDDDVTAITVTPVAGLVTTEAGGTASFTVVMTAQPTANVVIPVTSSNPAEGSVSAANLTFTAGNWNVPQTVTVTGVDDAVADGAVAYTVVLGAAVSADPNANGLDPADVAVSNTDDDAAAITVTPVAGLTTTEAGGSATFSVVLTSQPTANVVIPVTSTNPAEGSVSPANLTFTAADWNTAQTVTITGVNDAVVDGTVAYGVTVGAAVSTDTRYSGMDPADVAVSNTDDDAVGVTVTPVAGLNTSEAGGSATFSMVLLSQPVADVVFALGSTDLTEGTVSPASVTFTAANWNTPQVVTVTGVNDPVTDGDVAYSIVTSPAASSDPLYSGMDPSDVGVLNHDDQDGTSITLELVPDRDRVQQGQPVGFRLSVRNRTSQPIDDIDLTHVLPARFAALKGTLAMNGALIADQAGGTQSLHIDQLAGFQDRNGDGVAGPGEPGYAEFRWQLVPGSGASAGMYVAQVSATSGCATCTVAQAVSASIRVEDDELFTRSTLLGRVFEDKNRDGQQAANEPGIANARVVMDDGTWVTTDAQGMFHVPDLEAGPRVIKMDLAQVGAAAIPTTDVAQVVNIAPGLLANVRFGVTFPRDTVSVGRPSSEGLAIMARDPEGVLDLSGSTVRSTLTLNGIVVPVAPTGEKVTLPAGEPHYPAVTLGSLAVSVDSLGRFATTVPNPGDDTLTVALVDKKGKVAAARVRLPRLDILSPRGDVRLPYGQATEDMKLAPKPGASGEALSDAGGEVAASGTTVAWTTLRGRTDAGTSVMVNGQTAAVANDGAFAVEVPLHLGENTIHVVAKDAQGMSNMTSVAVQVADRASDGAPVVAVDAIPELSLYLPPQGVALQSNALNLAGRTRPGYRVVVNGDSAMVNADGTFSRRMMLNEGANHLVVQVVDDRGRTSKLERDLEVRSPKMFLVAMADGVVGNSTGASFLRKGAGEGRYTEGRVAWNLRGWVAGKYLLTSAFDSRRREFGSLFKDLDDNGRDRLMTNIDPDRLYPVFGDSGSVQNSALQGGRLFVGLQGEAVRASLGNFPIALNDVELAGFRRTLYGAQMRIGKSAGGEGIPSGTSLALFGAQAKNVHVHDELEATGGTLYYLSHDEVLEGSAQITLVVRDRTTGLLLARVPQRLGTDVLVKELEGRVQFTRPVSSVWDDGSVIGNGRLQGHPVSIEVDYETRGSGAEKAAVGGRITQAVGNKLSVGGTVVDDASGNGNYRLRGTDLALKLAPGTKLSAEIATSSGSTGRAFTSTDGGLGFTESDSAGTQSGMAWKTAAEVDLGQLFAKPGVMSVSGYVRRVESGFLSDGERDGIALDRQGFRGTLNVGRYGRFTSRFDRETRPELNQTNASNGTDLFGLQWRQDGARAGAAAEFEQRNLSFVRADDKRNSAAAMRLWWKPVDKLKTTVEHQQALAGEKLTTSALGFEYRALSNLSLEARGSAGEQGKTVRGGATLTMGTRQFYMREEHTEAAGGPRSGTLFGMQAPLGPESRVYSEYQWQRDPLGDRGVSVTGIEQGWHHPSGVALQVAGEHGTRGGASGQHGTLSGMLSYKGNSPLSGSTRAEARRMMGTAYSRQMLSATKLELALPSGFTVLTDLRMSMSRRRVSNLVDYETPNRYTESSIGLAWRAPRSDAFQAVGRWTRLADRRGAGVADSLGTQSVMGVAALEATTRILPGVEWAVKGATRLAEDGRPGSASAVAHSSLFASRLDYQIMKQPFRLGVEYRLLSQRESSDHRTGWLNELSYDANQHMRFGFGYNFSRFSGDPLVREQDNARGWFLRAQSRY